MEHPLHPASGEPPDRQRARGSLLGGLFHVRNGLLLFSLALATAYVALPLLLVGLGRSGPASLLLATIMSVAILAMLAGSQITWLDVRFAPDSRRLYVRPKVFVAVTWGVFLAFVFITFATAPSIPFLSALSGASADELSDERGEFLKGRDGIGLGLLYLSTILTNTVVPYSIILLYATKSKLRHWLALAFFLFCISFLQKALFLNLILPLAAYFAASRFYRGKTFVYLMGGSILVLVVGTFLALGDESIAIAHASGDYFSASYLASDPLDYVLWRAIAVPVFTATDTLIVHLAWLRGELLWGATSSLLSSVFHLERINIERMVFEYQFGSWNEIANANAVFVVDAYVNYGWAGVVLFGLLVGQVFRWFRISRDVAFRALWPLFAFILFSAPLIGMLLSNGFLYMLFHALFIRVGRHDRHT
jgi:hypothetical protein